MVGVSLRVSWTLGSICGAFRSRVTLSRNRTSKLFNCPPRARRRRASEADRCSTYLRETEQTDCGAIAMGKRWRSGRAPRSEEHTSELQSLTNLVCRLLLEKTK